MTTWPADQTQSQLTYAQLPAVQEVDRIYRMAAADVWIDVSNVLSPDALTRYCAEGDSEASETAEQYLIQFSEVISAHSEKSTWCGRAGDYSSASDAALTRAELRENLCALPRDQIDIQITGSPRTCIEKLEAFAKSIDLYYVLALVGFGRIPRDKSIASMDRFSRHVMPHFARASATATTS